MDRPSFQFYADAWLGDFNLRSCSSACRGLWADMMCFMHQGKPYGHLRLQDSNGGYSVPSTEKLAKMTGNTQEETVKWLEELKHAGVPGITKNGVIFSRKMVRDEKQRKQWRKRQSTRRSKVSNSKTRHLQERDVTRDVTGDVTPMSRRSSSSSSSSSSSLNKKEEKKKKKRDAPTAPPPSPAVYWNPVPVWKKNDASHKSAVLRVDGEHLTQLIDDYPSVNVPGEIVNLKHHALNNPGWAKAKRDWRQTLGNWLKREARGNQSQSAAAAEVAWEQEQGQAPDNTAEIEACEKEHGPHEGRLTKRERYSFCAKGCGYRE